MGSTQSRQRRRNAKNLSGAERVQALAEWKRKEQELRPRSGAGQPPSGYSPQAYSKKSPWSLPTYYSGSPPAFSRQHWSGYSGRSRLWTSGAATNVALWNTSIVSNGAGAGYSDSSGFGGGCFDGGGGMSGGGGCDSGGGGGGGGGGSC